MKPSYRRGIEFIALNLDVGETIEDARGDIAVITLSEAFGKDQSKVASDVLRFQKKAKR